jgi:hypothetical protein
VADLKLSKGSTRSFSSLPLSQIFAQMTTFLYFNNVCAKKSASLAALANTISTQIAQTQYHSSLSIKLA